MKIQSFFILLILISSFGSCTFIGANENSKTNSNQENKIDNQVFYTNSPKDTDPPKDNDSLKIQPYAEVNKNTPTVVGYEDIYDPLEPVNRVIFKFNDVLYRYFLTPVAKAYNNILPDPISKSISSAFSNIREPLYSLNYLLQGEFTKSGQSLVRLAVNSTAGILGFFDPAKKWVGLNDNKTSFSNTLATYGVDYGLYIVIPVLGSSDLRDGSSMLFEFFAHPLNFVSDKSVYTYLLYYDGFHEAVPKLTNYKDIITEPDNEYIFIRNLYLERSQRDAQIEEGIPFRPRSGRQGYIK